MTVNRQRNLQKSVSALTDLAREISPNSVTRAFSSEVETPNGSEKTENKDSRASF